MAVAHKKQCGKTSDPLETCEKGLLKCRLEKFCVTDEDEKQNMHFGCDLDMPASGSTHIRLTSHSAFILKDVIDTESSPPPISENLSTFMPTA
jgi:hypothetical protein